MGIFITIFVPLFVGSGFAIFILCTPNYKKPLESATRVKLEKAFGNRK